MTPCTRDEASGDSIGCDTDAFCNFDDEAVQKFTPGLERAPLEYLNITGNKITDTGRDALAEAIKQSKLQYLTLPSTAAWQATCSDTQCLRSGTGSGVLGGMNTQAH